MANDVWDPMEEMKKFREDVENMFEGFWKKERKLIGNKELEIKEPSVDIEDKKKEFVVTADLPGIDRKDIDVDVEEDRVEIKAEKKTEKEEKNKDYYKQERSYSGFYRTIPLPAQIDPDKAKSKFDKGVLKISLPKVKQVERKKSKKLSIK